MKHFIAVFLFLYIGTSAQTHRFIYEVNYKKDSTSNIITKEFYHLDINQKDVAYYGRDYFIMDPLMTNNTPMTEENDKLNLSDIEIHDLNSPNYDTYELLQFDIIHLKSVDKQKWKLSNEKKMIGQYNVQKAETNWGGRHWTAWFAEEIPFPEGPYKFHGLPGIIMELSDSKGNYNFKLVKSKNFPETEKHPFFLKRAVFIPREKYVKTKMMYYNDPLAFLKNMNITLTPDNWAMLKDGTKVTLNNQKELIAKQQKLIRDYNNPIELDQAINYPSK